MGATHLPNEEIKCILVHNSYPLLLDLDRNHPVHLL